MSSAALLRDADNDAPVTWNSKIDIFDERCERVTRKAARGRADIPPDDVRDTSLYEFWWKFHQSRGRLSRNTDTRVVMVTPGWSADCACVLSDKHIDYARSAVIAYWRMMDTASRHAHDGYGRCFSWSRA